MATYGKKLLDINGNVILPKTRSTLVYMDNDETVEKTINDILSEITNIKNGTTVVGNATKLATARNIGNASFDGSGDISLEDIGAATAEQGTKADNAMPKSGGTFTGAVAAKGSVAKGSGAYLHNIHIPNVSTNIMYIILWT